MKNFSIDSEYTKRRILDKWYHPGEFLIKGKYVKGWYGWKIFENTKLGYCYSVPPHWKIKPGKKLTMRGDDKLDTESFYDCTCGIHMATKAWVKPQLKLHGILCLVFVPERNIDRIIIPYNGKYMRGYKDSKLRTDYMYIAHVVKAEKKQ